MTELATADVELFDEDGYPTDEALAVIEMAPFDQRLAAFRLAKQLWRFQSWVRETPGRDPQGQPLVVFRFATGGWSGNESLIGALNSNVMTHSCWALSRAGGLHIYRVPVPEKA